MKSVGKPLSQISFHLDGLPIGICRDYDAQKVMSVRQYLSFQLADTTLHLLMIAWTSMRSLRLPVFFETN